MKRLAYALVTVLFLLARAEAGEVLDIDQELQRLEDRIQPPLRISGAEFRVAVFTYEDPDETGLGNAIATVVAGEILLRSTVRSIGVLRYEGRLIPTDSEPLSYFDKVEKLTAAQKVTLAVWGRIARNAEGLTIDTYVQIPPEVRDGSFAWTVKLPERMGAGTLQAHLRPERIAAQRLVVPASAVGLISDVAKRLEELRARPEDDAPVTVRLPRGSVYWLDERAGSWVHIRAGKNRAGWLRAEGHCQSDCAPLLDAGRFAGGLLRFIDSREIVPETAPSLTSDAHSVGVQLRALENLRTALALDLLAELRPDYVRDDYQQRRVPPRVRSGNVEAELRRFADASQSAGAQSDAVPPGGAAFANIEALGRIARDLASQAQSRAGPRGAPAVYDYDELEIDREEIRRIAFDLARASLYDPRNTDVLQNLSVLFEYAGDHDRAHLAHDLAQQAEVSSRLPAAHEAGRPAATGGRRSPHRRSTSAE